MKFANLAAISLVGLAALAPLATVVQADQASRDRLAHISAVAFGTRNAAAAAQALELNCGWLDWLWGGCETDEPTGPVATDTAPVARSIPVAEEVAVPAALTNHAVTERVIERVVVREEPVDQNTIWSLLERVGLLESEIATFEGSYQPARDYSPKSAARSRERERERTDESIVTAISSGSSDASLNSLAVSGPATSTFANGLDLEEGCYAINGVCVGAGIVSSQWDSVPGGLSYTGGNVGIGTTTPSVAFVVAGESHLATTTISGGLTVIGNTTITQGGQLTVGDKIIAPGEIGLGTTSPSAKLAIQSTDPSQTAFLLQSTPGQVNPLIDVFGNSNTSFFRLTADGHVGIGTSTPAQALAVQGNGAFSGGITASSLSASALSVSGATTLASSLNGVLFGTNGVVSAVATSSLGLEASFFRQGGNSFGAGAVFGTNDSQPLAFETAGAERVTILSNGNVGIGVQSPNFTLHARDTLAVNGAFGQNPGLLVVANGGFNKYVLVRSGDDFGNDPSIAFSSNSASLRFGVESPQTFGGFSEKMRLTQTGNLGIGTTNPGAKLAVAGTASITGGGNFSGFNVSSNSGNAIAYMSNTGANTGGFGLSGDSGSTNDAWIISTVGGAGVGARGFSINQGSNGTALSAFGSTRFFIDKDTGNIGIGTTTPASTLAVGGSILSSALYGGATNVTVDANGNLIRDPSDANLKENVEAVSSADALEKVLTLRGVTFDWRDQEKYGPQRELGFIAQEVQAVIPEAVSDGGDYLSLSVKPIVAALVEALKAVWAVVEDLAAKVEGLTTLVKTERIDAERTDTETLCVGETCITESELQILLREANVSESVPREDGSSNEEPAEGSDKDVSEFEEQPDGDVEVRADEESGGEGSSEETSGGEGNAPAEPSESGEGDAEAGEDDETADDDAGSTGGDAPSGDAPATE